MSNLKVRLISAAAMIVIIYGCMVASQVSRWAVMAAILALGAAQNRPWEFHGELALRRVMTLSLSFDHRLVDGEGAARFLADLGGLLGDPGLAMLRDGGTGPLPLG